MAKGDHLYIKMNGYTHHRIDCGDETVIEYGGGVKGMLYGKNKVQKVPLKEFEDGKKAQVRNYEGKANSADLIVRKAESRLNENDYSLSTNNCEHLATWCKTNTHKSDQVEDKVAMVGGCGTVHITLGAMFVGAALYVDYKNDRKRKQ